MEIEVAGAASIDLATKDDLVGWHRKLIDKLQPPNAKYQRVYAAGATGSGFSGSGPTAIAFQPAGPPPGFFWAVQWVAIWVGLTPAAAATANLFAALMVGRTPVGPGQQAVPTSVPVNNSDVVVPGQAVPASITVPDKTIVRPGGQLYVLLAGAGLAASTNYNAAAGLLEMPASDEAVLW